MTTRELGVKPFVAESLVAPSAMHERYGRLAQAVFSRLFASVQYPPECAERVRALCREGVVVYVARARSSLLALYFNYALSRLGLPIARFVGGVNLFIWQPISRLCRLLRARRRAARPAVLEGYGDKPPTPSESLLAEIVGRGQAAFLFLKPTPRYGRGTEAERHDYFRALVAAQRLCARPIYLVPHAVTDPAMSGTASMGLGSRLFGDRRRPGTWRHFAILVATKRRATVRVADPINLRELVLAHPDADDVHLARRARHEINHRISEEERVVAGPELPGPAATERHVLRDVRLRAALDQQSAATGKPLAILERRARSCLREIAARYHVRYLRFLGFVVRTIFDHIYDGILVDEAGLRRVVEASRRGPLVFCPAHRSHVDYLVLSLILWEHGVTPPHIAAGVNLAFFPLGPLFRGAGAFFLRRSFRDDAIYSAVLSAYVQELVRQGTSIEVFLEGTRSRTGKVLMPKFGMLNMLVSTWRAGAREDLRLVPVSIDYERIIEARAYEREIRGEEKKREDLAGLLRSTGVLRSRYGRVHVQFGEPISLAETARAWKLSQNEAAEHDNDWRHGIERLAYRVMHRVAGVATITPTSVVATALLGHPGRGLAESSLLAACDGIIEYLEDAGARFSDALHPPGQRTDAVLEAVRKLVDDAVVTVNRPGRSDVEPIYAVAEERRIQLDFYKNSVMNHFAPASIVARSIRRRGGTTVRDGARSPRGAAVAYRDLHADSRFLSKLFKREFLYRADADFDTLFDDTLASLAIRGLLDVYDDGTVVVQQARVVSLLAGLLDSYVQAYWVTAQTLRDLRQFPLWEKELATRALERARRAFLEGTISRPEAASRTVVETALAWMETNGVLVASLEGRRSTLRLAESYAPDELEGLIAEIGAYL